MAGAPFRRREKKFSKKMTRALDPVMLLSRGLSARFVGANVMQSIAPLGKEEIEKDLRHMNAYYQANVAYAQQHYMFVNREQLAAQGMLHGTGHVGPNGGAAGGYYPDQRPEPSMSMMPIAMPVRIDPEEEKRLQNLRKKIALCETQREFLESQYVSLRAHFVATTKELATAAKANEALTTFLQAITKRRARVLALERARLQIAREVLAALNARVNALEVASAGQQDGATSSESATASNGETKDNKLSGEEPTKMDVDSPNKSNMSMGASLSATSEVSDIVQVWGELEELLKDAEALCRKVPSTLGAPQNSEKKSKKKSKKGGAAATDAVEEVSTTAIIPWDAIHLPNTPQEVPLYLSQLATVPEKGAAFGTSGLFGSRESSMCWLESNLPKTYNATQEEEKLVVLRDEVKLLEEELSQERSANRGIQADIIDRRKRNDELVAMMTLLRGETEAILQRHNILLDSPEAKKAARKLHEEKVRKRAQSGQSGATEEEAKEDDDNDGDDEGEVGEDEDEDGEIVEGGGPVSKSDSGKRDLEEGEFDEDSSSPGRKRRKL